MAKYMKFDGSKLIPGYDSMSTDEKIAALENLEIPADQTDEVVKLKRNLSMAYTELESHKHDAERRGEVWQEMTYHPAKAEDEASIKKDLEIGRTAQQLTEAGFSYADALRSAQAINAGDYATAAEIQRRYHEQAAQTPAAQERREDAELRRIFGLR